MYVGNLLEIIMINCMINVLDTHFVLIITKHLIKYKFKQSEIKTEI